MTKHRHHIIPKHAGRTDDNSNLIELTIEEHAEEHRKVRGHKTKNAWTTQRGPLKQG